MSKVNLLIVVPENRDTRSQLSDLFQGLSQNPYDHNPDLFRVRVTWKGQDHRLGCVLTTPENVAAAYQLAASLGGLVWVGSTPIGESIEDLLATNNITPVPAHDPALVQDTPG